MGTSTPTRRCGGRACTRSPAGSMRLGDHQSGCARGSSARSRPGSTTAARRSTITATPWGRRGRCRTSSWSTTARAAVPAMRHRDQADRPRRAIDLLPRMPAAQRRRRASQGRATPHSRARASMSAPLPLPDGFEVGHWTDSPGATGCTAVLAPPGTRGGVDVRGGGPGTRETDVIGALRGNQRGHGGRARRRSAFGLAAADGAVRWLEERGRGYRTAGASCRSSPRR